MVFVIALLLLFQMGLSVGQTVACVSFCYLPWVLKLWWKPYVDRLQDYRFWILLTQFLLMLTFALMAFLLSERWAVVALLWLAGWLAAVHNVAVDGFVRLHPLCLRHSVARELFRKLAVGVGQGVLVMLAGNLQVFYRNDLLYSWRCMIYLVAGLFLLLLFWHWGHTKVPAAPDSPYFPESHEPLGPPADTTRQKGSWLFLLLFPLAQALLTKVSVLFLIDTRHHGGLGLSPQELGFVLGTVGIIGLSVGGILGQKAIRRYGFRRCLWPMALLMTVPALVYALLSYWQPADLMVVAGSVLAEQTVQGFAFSVYLFYLSRIVNREQGKSLMAFSLLIGGLLSALLQQFLGYNAFFVLVLCLSVLMLLSPLFTLNSPPGMKKLSTVITLVCLVSVSCFAQSAVTPIVTVRYVAKNAVRIQYAPSGSKSSLPDWLYVRHDEEPSPDIKAVVKGGDVTVMDRTGHVVFHATSHRLQSGEATLVFDSPKDESLFGLGQFQDGYSNVRGLSRRLTQVNTQISVPMLLSSQGYGILWNNYGLTEFNPCDQSVRLSKRAGAGQREQVNVTTTEGGKQEIRERHLFEGTVDIKESGEYALLLDVGQKMARRYHLAIDGQPVIEMQNLWLPPTTSKIVRMEAGVHRLTAELTQDDRPVLYYRKVTDQTVFRSPVAEAVDYTVFVGTADEVIASYRHLTGSCPEMPSWALGYIHCRERFHSSDEILQTANRFRSEHLPVSMLVQDWQYWGRHGWNSMRFDEAHYPDPKALTDSLHRMGMRLMLSVWSKIDRTSEVGRQMSEKDYYIPGTDWIDFFNPDAAACYWKHFEERLVPLGIDAWWQDATEPENDDLAGRRVNCEKWSGEQVRNVYPLLVCKTVYEGLKKNEKCPMILTRCGFPGIQRYGVALWSGDVGNDWETFRRQLTAGLGIQAAGIPWWTYDAGGFFRPGDQYTNQDYIERMLRWIETSVYLPLMRVHGYMSDTEPWNYGPEAQAIIADCLRERYRLLPYIERCAKAVSEQGYTLMRPLVFDFADDPEALRQPYEYMFGPDLLISPVTEPRVTTWRTYLPRHEGGWFDYRTGQHYDGGQYVTTPVTRAYIPVFLRAKNM